MYRTVCLVGLAAVLATAACSTEGDAASAVCVEGQSVTCSCDDGRDGARICRPDGTLRPCECGAAAAPAGAGTAAGDPAAGEQPTGGSGPGSGEEPADSSGPGSGEEPTDSSGPGSGEEPTDSSGPGSGEEPTDSSGPGSGELSPLFGYCELDTDCEVELECLMNGGITGYCAERCSGGGGGLPFPGLGGSGCIQPEAGGVQASCNGLTGLCTLGDCSGDGVVCPEGMHCMEQSGGFPSTSTGECRYGD